MTWMSLRLLIWWPREFEPDSSARGGGKGLSDDAIGTFGPGQAPRLPLETDLGLAKEVCFSAVGAMGLTLTR